MDVNTPSPSLPSRVLGRTGMPLTALGFGAFKIGRNQKIKYARGYRLPSDDDAERLLNAVLDMGIHYLDTAPAYGISEERIGRFLAHRQDEFIVSTKVGETFEGGESSYDFTEAGTRASIDRSRKRLKRDVLDIVFIHSDGNDQHVLEQTAVVPTLLSLREQGVIKAVGFSGKTVEGARASLRWADAVMVTYHQQDTSHADVIAEAHAAGVGVVVKKGLASGSLPADQAIRFVLQNKAVTSLVVGGLNETHLRANVASAAESSS